MLTPLAYFLIVMILVAAGAVVLDQRNFIFGSLLIFSMILGVLAAYLKLTGYVIDQHWTALALALLAFPVVALLAIIVWLVHNTNIISHREGKSFTAKLSLFLALTLGLDFYLLFLVGNVHGAYARFAYISGLGVYNTFLLLFISYLLYSFVYQIWPTPKKADYIIVLGSYIHNGRVTPLLQSRVDKELAYYRAAAADHRPKLVVSGGQGADESTSEANAMKEYLLSVGVPDQDIIVEDQSRNTFENFMFSKEKILQDWQGQNGQQPVILFATSNYHVMRASLYSKRIGFRARGIGAPTSFYFLPTALIREYVGILSYYRIIAFMLFVFEAFLAYLLAF